MFFALAVLGFILLAAQQLRADDVSFEFFYDNLNDGNWVEAGDYGYCWQPNVASDSSWRPYADGFWAYTDVGWTWVSNEDFGWATYHYGRWAKLASLGWVWIPGTEWGPAWVSWRIGGDQIGWAPLPPTRSGEPVYEGRTIGGQVDIEFDIGPLYYNFVDVRYIGEPRLRERIYEPSRNVAFIRNTVNVTNITYTNTTVYNHGPDYSELSERSSHPIQRLTLHRQTNVGAEGGFRASAATKVEAGRLEVTAPITIKKTPPTVAPKAVKTKIAHPKLETGWSGITDPNAKVQLQEKMKTEDSKKIPPATTNEVAAGSAPTPATTTSVGPVATTTPVHSASPGVSAAPTSSPAEKGKGSRGHAIQPEATPLGTPIKASPLTKAPNSIESKTPPPAASIPAKGPNRKEAAHLPPEERNAGVKGKAVEDAARANRNTRHPTFSPPEKATSKAPIVSPTVPRQERVGSPKTEMPVGTPGRPKTGDQPKRAIERQTPSVPPQRGVAPAGDGSHSRNQEKQPTPKKTKKGEEPAASATPG